METPITFDYQGHTILGIYHKANDPYRPGVIYIHGIPGDRVDTRRIFVRMARRLQKQNIAGLRVDLYASGVSVGNFQELTYSIQLSQLSFLIRSIQQKALWYGPLILLGFSLGATLAISAAQTETDVNGICVWSGFIASETWQDFSDLEVASQSRREKINGNLYFDTNCGLWVNKTLFFDMQKLSINHIDMLPNIPILGIYGSKDAGTSRSSALLRQACHQVIIVEEADHLFTSTRWEEALMGETERWIQKQFL